MPWGFEPAHASFPLPSRLMGILGAVVEVAVLPMFDAGEDLTLGRTVAPQLIGNDHPWRVAEALQQLAEECLGGFLAALALHQDIEPMPVLIDRPPQIVAFTPNGEKHLIQMPFIPRPGMPAAQLSGVGLSEFPTPVAYRLMRQDEATLRHELLHVPIAQAEAEVQPYAMANNLRREPMALVRIGCGWWVHEASMAYGGDARQGERFPRK